MIGASRGAGLVLVVALVALVIGVGPASAGTANAGLGHTATGNPLAGMKWGVYEGPIDGVWPAYAAARGRARSLLGKIALRPRAVWAGFWDTNARETARESIQDSAQGDPNVLTQVALFRLNPWESCSGSWSAGNQAAYRAWVRSYAAGIGSSRVALILQPDLPFAACVPTAVPEQLVSYAATVFNALPHTTVYIDAGAYGWDRPATIAQMLERSGIRRSRGFALDVTQYGSTDLQLQWGAAINRDLAAAGARDKHFVINTDENGTPYLAGQVPGGAARSNYTPPCNHPGQQVCQRLGIPPTTDVANPRWHLSAADRSIAAAQADAYLWVGRPWMINAGPFSLRYALTLGANGVY
ncbi:MAG: glycoside hydrolase family 6 protein [Solirubrobacteraceae bacterium]